MEIEVEKDQQCCVGGGGISTSTSTSTSSMDIHDVDLEKAGGIGGVVSYGGDDGAGIYLVWEDLMAVIPSFGNEPTKRLLNGLTGYAEPGNVLAVMGPSGSGKSTLLDSLAGRLSGNVIMTGNVLFNGSKRRIGCGGGFAYVTQEDAVLGTLTVRETITYSAHLRLPCSITNHKEELNHVIDRTLMEMGLQDCADHLIGNWHLRGISGGEKKRLSIGLEIMTRPRLLFLDEPTTGLDSAAAFFVTQILRNIAHNGPTTVISSIHQPSSEVFGLFDYLFLISGGQTVYFGEANMAIKFFGEAGFGCPSRRNPSDHFLRCINSDFDNVAATLKGSQRVLGTNKSSSVEMTNLETSEIKDMLVKKYKCSNYATKARARIREISNIEGLVMMTRNGSQATWWKQLSILTRRSFVNMSRDVGYYWLRIITYIVVSICVGTIFFNLGTGYSDIFARGSCGGFISGFMIFMSIGGFPSFIEEAKIFHRERMNGHYGVGVFVASNFLSSLPFLVVMGLSTASISYFMVGFGGGFSHFAFSCLNLISCIAVVESCMMVVASLVPNFLMGLIIGAGIIGVMMMTAGFFRFIPDIPKPFWRYPISYINYMSWALQGEYKNDMIGLEFDPLTPGDPKVKGEFIIKTMMGVSVNHSKWWDLAVVMGILVVYRLLFLAIIKLKERASPLFQRIYTKRSVHHLHKRASFRKTIPSFPSQRHQVVVHSLSSQEGLNSPIH